MKLRFGPMSPKMRSDAVIRPTPVLPDLWRRHWRSRSLSIRNDHQ